MIENINYGKKNSKIDQRSGTENIFVHQEGI